MIVPKEDYKIPEVAYLLDLPARTVLALCDGGVIACSRVKSEGLLKQRKRRQVSHAEVCRFNATRDPLHRSDLASRLTEPEGPRQLPLSIMEADPDGDSVWIALFELRVMVAALAALSKSHTTIAALAERFGPAGAHVAAKGLKVKPYEGPLS